MNHHYHHCCLFIVVIMMTIDETLITTLAFSSMKHPWDQPVFQQRGHGFNIVEEGMRIREDKLIQPYRCWIAVVSRWRFAFWFRLPMWLCCQILFSWHIFMTYDDIQYSISYLCISQTFPSIHPFQHGWVDISPPVRENLGHKMTWCNGFGLMFEGPYSGHGGTQMPRNWGARGLSQKIPSCEAFDLPKTMQLNIEMFWGVQAWLWSSYPDCCAPGERSKGMKVQINWNHSCKDSVLDNLVWIWQKDMKLDVSPKKQMIYIYIYVYIHVIVWMCFISFVFCKNFKLFLNVHEIEVRGSYSKNRSKTSLAQSLRRAMA